MSFYDDASLIMFPSGYKEDKIYSLKPTDGSGDLTFTRASTATRVNSDGLIEGVRTNLVTYSNDFSNAAWVKVTNPTITANATTSPDGTTNADKLIPSTSVGRQAVSQNNSSTGAVSMSVYAKKGEYDIVQLTDSRNPTAFANFDLTNGVLGSVSDFTATIVSVGSGWYRCSISYNYTLSLSAFRISVQQLATDVRLPEWAGNGTDGIYIYGAQLELSASATEYIPTTTTAVSVGMLANVPRIDFTGGGCGKLLLEPQRTNLFTYSEQFDNAGWAKQNATITANQTTSPSGYVDADLYTTTGTSDYAQQGVSGTSGTAYTISFFVKNGNANSVGIVFTGAAYPVAAIAEFNLLTETSSVTAGTATASIQNYGNGWYRIVATSTAGATGTTIARIVSLSGSAVSTFYVYGAQAEAGSYVSSYVPTLASSVTRLADAAFKTVISSLIGQTEGTIFAEVANLFPSGSRTIALLYTSGSAFYQMYVNSSNQVRVDVNGLFIFAGGSIAANTNYKIAFAYKSGDYALYINGAQVATSASTTMPSSLTAYYLGNSIGSEQSGAFSQALLFKTRLTNAELATLTTL